MTGLPRTPLCDGVCGPDIGENCFACTALDQQYYGGSLPPLCSGCGGVVRGVPRCPNCGAMVSAMHSAPGHVDARPNRAGRMARRSPTNGLYYCAVYGLPRTPTCDGQCGPTDGDNCVDCAALGGGGPPPTGVHPGYGFGAPPVPTGFGGGVRRKKALLIGITYKGTEGEIPGCAADVQHMANSIQEMGFAFGHDSFLILSDSLPDPDRQPTRANILRAFNWLAGSAQPGDIMFLSFAGHGAQRPDPTGREADGMNETIVPVDFFTHKVPHISDDEIWEALVHRLPNGAKLTALFDCCRSGTGMDLPFVWDCSRNYWYPDVGGGHSLGDVVMISGCADGEFSFGDNKGGAMTLAFRSVLRQSGSITYFDLLQEMRRVVKAAGFKQVPQMSSTQPFNLSRIFSLDAIIPDMGLAPPGRKPLAPGGRPPRPKPKLVDANVLAASGMIGSW